jgi:glycosyltransferase involved in cell wall biosynthesis
VYAIFPSRLAVPVVSHARDLLFPRWVGRLVSGRSNRVIVPSRACAGWIRRVAPRARVDVVSNGVDLDHPALRAGERPEADDGPVVMVANIAPWKGHELFLNAAEYARERLPSLRFAIIGDDVFDDQSDLSRTLWTASERLRNAGCLDWIRCDDAMPWIAGAQMLVHPAYPEPFGRVVVEALACARPVVAFAGAHGPAEILADRRGGMLVAPRRGDVLGRAILALATDPHLRRRLAREARAKADAYDRRRTGRAVEALYSSVLAEATCPA